MRSLIVIGALALGLSGCQPAGGEGERAGKGATEPAANEVVTFKKKTFEGPDKTTVNASELSGVNLNTEVIFQSDFVTAPEMTDAAARAIGIVADRVRSGGLIPSPETKYAQFRFVAVSKVGTDKRDLLNIRVPLERIQSAPTEIKPQQYLDLADVVEEGGDPQGLTAPRGFCERHRKVTPKFCALVDQASRQ